MSDKDKDMQELISRIDVVTGEDGKSTINLPHSGDLVEIRECRGRDISTVLRLLTTLIKTVDLKSLSIATQHSGLPENVAALIQAVGTHADLIFDTASSLCSLSKNEIENLRMDDVVVLIIAVSRVNFGFFSQTILPMLVQATNQNPSESQLQNLEVAGSKKATA